jgi:hypothetical protein
MMNLFEITILALTLVSYTVPLIAVIALMCVLKKGRIMGRMLLLAAFSMMFCHFAVQAIAFNYGTVVNVFVPNTLVCVASFFFSIAGMTKLYFAPENRFDKG